MQIEIESEKEVEIGPEMGAEIVPVLRIFGLKLRNIGRLFLNILTAEQDLFGQRVENLGLVLLEANRLPVLG